MKTTEELKETYDLMNFTQNLDVVKTGFVLKEMLVTLVELLELVRIRHSVNCERYLLVVL